MMHRPVSVSQLIVGTGPDGPRDVFPPWRTASSTLPGPARTRWPKTRCSRYRDYCGWRCVLRAESRRDFPSPERGVKPRRIPDTAFDEHIGAAEVHELASGLAYYSRVEILAEQPEARVLCDERGQGMSSPQRVDGFVLQQTVPALGDHDRVQQMVCTPGLRRPWPR